VNYFILKFVVRIAINDEFLLSLMRLHPTFEGFFFETHRDIGNIGFLTHRVIGNIGFL
jgi:hypothetical protein